MSESMRAAQVAVLEGPSAVRVVELPVPEPGPDDVLIRVQAAGLTFPDVLLSKGEYQVKPELPFVLGTELSGTVERAPAGSALAPGDRVAAFSNVGGLAEYAAVDRRCVFAIPAATTFADAAALPMNYLTMQFALVRRGRLEAGERVLVHGAAGGIGTAAIQLIESLGGESIAVVSSAAKGDVARAAGARHVVAADTFKAEVAELTGGRGVDMIVDPVGGDRFTDSLRSLAPEGRLLVIGFAAGDIPQVKVNRLLLNNISVVGVGWGAFWISRPDFLAEQWTELYALLERGALQPVIGASYPLDRIADALTELDERRATGKILVTVP